MRQIRSADPWSAFLNTRRRPEGARPAGAVPPGEPGPADPGAASGAESGLGQAERRVLARLRSADGHMSLEQLHHATGLGLLEVAEAVDALRGRGLVSVEREIDEIVRLTEG